MAAENELGWAPRGSPFLVLRASHSLIEARVHAGDGESPAKLQGVLSNGGDKGDGAHGLDHSTG
jgi:hypothetical protein